MLSKVRVGYCGNEGSYNGGYNLRRWNLTNDSNTGTFSKQRANCGEENFTMGQDWGYMIGNYDGAQNNGTWQQYYHTDSRTDIVDYNHLLSVVSIFRTLWLENINKYT